MSQPHTKAGQSKSTPAANQKAQNPAQPGAKKASKGDKLWIAGILFALVAGTAVTLLIRSSNEAPRPVVSADEDSASDMGADVDPNTDEDAIVESGSEADFVEEESEAGAATPADASALTITSNVRGADVFLNGKRVGVTPHKATPLAPGSYTVKVAHSGYDTFETSVDVSGPDHTLRADLKARRKSNVAVLSVNSNVSGAKVMLDGEERGTTPVEIKGLSPGAYELVVSASGYRSHSETVEYSGGAKDIRVDLKSTQIVLNEAVAVKHKHRLGGCEGVLRASADGIRFETDHKDAFFVSFSDLERLSLEGDTLNLKVDGGRNYNFVERNDNADALARFHEQVDSARAN